MKNICSNVIEKITLCAGVVFMGNANALIAAGGVPIGGDKPELILIVYDKVKEVSYTKDLGIYAAPYSPENDNSKNFFVQAQQDAGYQKFFEPLNSDTNFKEFLKYSTSSADQVWAIYAGGSPDFFGPGAQNVYTTLSSTWVGGGANPEWTLLAKIQNQNIQALVGAFTNLAGDLNSGKNSSGGGVGADNIFNSHYRFIADPEELIDYSLSNGSSFDMKGVTPYFPAIPGLGGDTGMLEMRGAATVNPVGSSSWFYYLTGTTIESTGIALVDEFDNLEHDGYWGLAVDTKGDYILSFTMEGILAKVATAQGLARRNGTDFAALYGGVRSLSNPIDEFAGWTPSNALSVSAVPEPATYGLFGLGLAALVWRKRQLLKA